MNRILISFSLVLLAALPSFGQSKTVADFSKTAEGHNVYLYQSLIRVMNKDANPDFNSLIKDLDHFRLLTTDSVGASAKAVFDRLDQGVQQEGFEEILAFNNPDYRCHLYELEDSNGKTTWVATLFSQGMAGILEMKGSLDMRYLHAFSSLNTDHLEKMRPASIIPK
jgi:hypothetical protein